MNASYQWNGSSVLAGNPATGESADFPDQVAYAAGADVGVNTALTFAFDVLGRYVIDASGSRQDVPRARRPSVFPNIVFDARLVQRAQRLARHEGQLSAAGCCWT